MEIRPYAESDEKAVAALWREVFPGAPAHNHPETDIQRKLAVQRELFFVATQGDELVGTAMGGYDGHRGWVYYVVVSPRRRRQGIGTALMAQVEEGLARMGCPKLNLQVRANNHEVARFYEKLGYEAEERISMGKRLKPVSFPPLVATDATDSCARPLDFLVVHAQGIPHRTVHIEIANKAEEYLVWERADGRLEIPGGHVDWLEEQDRPESYAEAATRELSEELNLPVNWKLPLADIITRLQGRLLPTARLINQVKSTHGNNNEWVTVYNLCWQDEWGNPCEFVLGEEGNKSPRWLSLKEIKQQSLERPMDINAAMRLFLRRRGILIPMVQDSKV